MQSRFAFTYCSKWNHGNTTTLSTITTKFSFTFTPIRTIHSPDSFRKHLIRDSDTPMFFVYRFELLVRVWIVSLVLVLTVTDFSGCVSSQIPVVLPYILFVCFICLIDTLWWVCACLIFTSFRIHHSFNVTSHSPVSRLFSFDCK